jgi:3-hydroxy-9,10-secoandrosta-1,3,5(10)-triene-9,17-dione monooxygenase
MSEVTVPSAESLIQWAKDFVPTLRERSADCEDARLVLAETVQNFIVAGVPRIGVPVEFGGYGLGLDVAGEVAMQIGRGCASSAWMSAQWPGHSFIIGMFPRQAQEEYWAASPDVLSSTAGAIAKLDIQPADGGYKVSAHYRFSSGIDHAAWVIMITPEKIFLIPKAHFEIEDDWFVAGLRGTGSKSIHVNDVFVPEHRSIPSMSYFQGRTFGTDLYPNNPFYKIPFAIWGGMMLASPTLGMAQGVIDLFEQRVHVRKSLHTMGPAIEQPGNQLRFAEATAAVDAARLILRDNYVKLRQWGSGLEEMPLQERARFRRDATFSTRLCVKAVDSLYESGDASALYDANQIQRLVRDIHAAALQVSQTWDEPAIQYSRVRWGLPPQTNLL